MRVKVEGTKESEIIRELKKGNEPFFAGGYHTKQELLNMRDSLSKKLGKKVRVGYTGPNTHKYYFAIDE